VVEGYLVGAFSLNGKQVISGLADHIVRLWDATIRVLLLTLGGYSILSLITKSLK
jgi:hypothetical protein